MHQGSATATEAVPHERSPSGAECSAAGPLPRLQHRRHPRHIEVVPPCGDLSVRDVEGTHDGQGGGLALDGEDVGPLGQHGRAVAGQVVDLELEGVAHADEHVDHRHRGLNALGRLHRDVVVDDLVREEAAQLVRVPRAHGGTEVPDDLFGAGHGSPLLGGRAAHATQRSAMMRR